MQHYFLQLFDFDHWANMALYRSLTQLPTAQRPPRAGALFSHLLATHHVWHARLTGNQPTLPIWPELSPQGWAAELAAMWQRNQHLLAALRNEADFSQPVAYANSKGIAFTSSIEDILTHLLAHSCYHQGQIVQQLKGVVDPLPDLNYISYVRRQGQPGT